MLTRKPRERHDLCSHSPSERFSVSESSKDRHLGNYRSRTVFSKKAAYALLRPSRSGTFAVHPNDESSDMSSSLRGVPSGFDGSKMILPRYPTTSATMSANSAMLTSFPAPTLMNCAPE